MPAPHRSSQLAQLVDGGQLCHRLGQFDLRLRVIDGCGLVFHRFLGGTHGLKGLGFVEVGTANGGIGQDGHRVGLHFKNAARNVNQLFFGLIRHLDTNRAGLERGEQRGVARINTEFTALTGSNHNFGGAGVERFFCADNVNVDGHGHCLFPLCEGRRGEGWEKAAGFTLPFPLYPSPGFTALLNRLRLFDGFFDAADHVESLFGQMIVFTFDNRLEAGNGLFQGDVFAGRAGKHFSDEEGLRQEALDFTGTRHGQLVFRRQFVHTQNRDDVAQFLVLLQRALHRTGHAVVLLAHHLRVENTRGRIERIHRRVNTQFGNLTRQHQGCVQVGKGGGGRRVGQVIRRHVHGLERGDRAGARRGDALLQAAHFVSQRRLVAHRGRHPAQQRGHFGTGQGVTVDVVDEQQHVAAFVTEVLSHGQTGQRDAQTVAGRLVHLAVDQRDLVQHAAFFHLVIEVVAFTGPLTHACEHRETGVRHRDVADQLHQRHGLAHAGAAEQADLAALGDRHDQVDHLDAGFENLDRGRLIGIGRRLAVNRHVACRR